MMEKSSYGRDFELEEVNYSANAEIKRCIKPTYKK